MVGWLEAQSVEARAESVRTGVKLRSHLHRMCCIPFVPFPFHMFSRSARPLTETNTLMIVLMNTYDIT